MFICLQSHIHIKFLAHFILWLHVKKTLIDSMYKSNILFILFMIMCKRKFFPFLFNYMLVTCLNKFHHIQIICLYFLFFHLVIMNYFVLYSSETQKIKKIRKREDVENVKDGHLRVTSSRMFTSLKWGRMTCPCKRTFECEVSFSKGPSSNHCKVTPMAAWVVSLNVRVGLTFGLIDS